jgi:hypothetical protein
LLGKKFSEESKKKMRESAKHRVHPSKLSEEEQRVRDEAKTHGDKYYEFSRPCKRGHIGKRFVKSSSCSICAIKSSNARTAFRYRNTEPELLLYKSARQRSAKEGSVCSITLKDIRDVWPSDNHCPILGIKLVGQGKTKPESPTLDRIHPDRGYVVGNIAVISYAANRSKQNITDPNVFNKLADWLETALSSSALPNGEHVCTKPPSRCPCYRMWDSAKRLSSQKNLAFNLTPEYIKQLWPQNNKCPILDILLERNFVSGPKASSPTLDKLRPELGYVVGNVAIISAKANMIKNDITDPNAFRKLASWLRVQQDGK